VLAWKSRSAPLHGPLQLWSGPTAIELDARQSQACKDGRRKLVRLVEACSPACREQPRLAEHRNRAVLTPILCATPPSTGADIADSSFSVTSDHSTRLQGWESGEQETPLGVPCRYCHRSLAGFHAGLVIGNYRFAQGTDTESSSPLMRHARVGGGNRPAETGSLPGPGIPSSPARPSSRATSDISYNKTTPSRHPFVSLGSVQPEFLRFILQHPHSLTMVRLLQLGALGLALCGVSNAVALPQAETDSAGRPGAPKCKGLTKRREWCVSLSLRLPRKETAS